MVALTESIRLIECSNLEELESESALLAKFAALATQTRFHVALNVTTSSKKIFTGGYIEIWSVGT